MHTRLFRLIEKHQRIDDRLRLAQRRRSAEIQRLQELKRKAKRLIERFVLRSALAGRGL